MAGYPENVLRVLIFFSFFEPLGSLGVPRKIKVRSDFLYKNGIFTGFEPHCAAGLAEQPIFFAFVIWHPNEGSVGVSALNSVISYQGI